MDDLISRAAAKDYIDSQKGRPFIGCTIGEAMKIMLDEVPSVQPEIIRCKDCKHYQFADNRAFGFPVMRCEWTGFEDVDDNDFCSRGERKERDGNG